ncbi:hypothetical protein CPB84DRAFT_1789755 [Gymnopilus junonius]|uniref:Uncharacterized protein n=1 Tax=Gymnopilus junonius TaxID=109634 RepID=A0A9P5NHH8_GYMJU|nr:hypothetical protein CPB84DRAFT_1789755 [Gymnopilus junonius]
MPVSTLSTQTDTADKQEKTTTTVEETQASQGAAASTPIAQAPQSTFPQLQFSYKRTYIVLYILFLIICNVAIPVVLFYPLVHLSRLSRQNVVGISSAALGLSSCFDAPARLYRLVRYRRLYGPLGSDIWWHLDFSMWTLTFALLIFAIPLAVGPAAPSFDFFLMSTVMLVGPVGLVFFVSLYRPKLPFRCSSDPPGVPMKPAVFYLIEDVASVDFRHQREFRRALYARWTASPPFQHLMASVTLFWVISSTVYIGATAAVTFNTPLNFAFGWTLGQLFIWAGVSAIICRMIVKISLKKEREWWEREKESRTDQFGQGAPV